MNLDELRSVQSKERSKDSLQHLRESFYSDVADYIADLREQREQAAEVAESPFDDPEVNRLTDEIHTAEEVVEAIYERRVGKVVKRASLSAAGVPTDDEGLTSEEQVLFSDLVDRIEANKEAVLDVLAGEDVGGPGKPPEAAPEGTEAPSDSVPDPGEAPTATGSDRTTTDAPDGDVSAADVMGGDPAGASDSETDDSRPKAAEAAAVAATDAPTETAGAPSASPQAETAGDATADGGTQTVGGESDAADGVTDAAVDATGADSVNGLADRTTVRVTDDVGEIFGVDERTYDLASEDVVTLPEENAEPLLERDAAEKLG